MKKATITIAFDDEKLAALEFSLQKENTTVQDCLDKALAQLYEKSVPESLREYVENKTTSVSRPKRPVRTSASKVQAKAGPPQAAPSAIASKSEEESK